MVRSPFLAHCYRAICFQTVIKTEHQKMFLSDKYPSANLTQLAGFLNIATMQNGCHAKYKNLCFCLKNIIVWSVLMGLLCFLHSCSAVKAPIQNIMTQFNSLLCLWRLETDLSFLPGEGFPTFYYTVVPGNPCPVSGIVTSTQDFNFLHEIIYH